MRAIVLFGAGIVCGISTMQPSAAQSNKGKGLRLQISRETFIELAPAAPGAPVGRTNAPPTKLVAAQQRAGPGGHPANYFANRFPTSFQFTTLHHAPIYSGRRFWYLR